MTKSRLEAFTDAVIAIIMTIMVLNLEAPKEATFAALWDMRYRFAIYLISFISLAIYWNNHHHLFQAAPKISGKVMWLNIVFLLCLSLYPFTASWVDVNLNERVPELTYGMVVLAANCSYALLVRALVKLNGPDSQVAKALAGYRKTGITLGINVAGLVAGYFFPPAVMILFGISMLLWVVPERRIEEILGKAE